MTTMATGTTAAAAAATPAATPMANRHDIRRNQCMLTGVQAYRGYDWWWHSFTGVSERTGLERSFFIEFFLCNPELALDEPAFGLEPDGRRSGRQRPSYLMVKAGAWGTEDAAGVQLHRFFPWKDVDLTWGAPFCVVAEDCLCCETDLIGHVSVSPEDAVAHPEWMSDAGEMTWDLHLDKKIPFNVGYGASAPMRQAQAFEMYWHAEGMKTELEGFVIFNGERFVVTPETSFGYADKNWGQDFTTPWVWLSSWDLHSNLTGEVLEDSVFDIGGGRPVVAGVALDRKLLGCLTYRGQCYEFNFSKPWTGSTTVFDCHETPTQIVWHVEQSTLTARLVTDITCDKARMILANYESPDGAKRHTRLWNGGNGTGRLLLYTRAHAAAPWQLVDDIAAVHIGCEYGEYGASYAD